MKIIYSNLSLEEVMDIRNNMINNSVVGADSELDHHYIRETVTCNSLLSGSSACCGNVVQWHTFQSAGYSPRE